jgi:hypothetical protein
VTLESGDASICKGRMKLGSSALPIHTDDG